MIATCSLLRYISDTAISEAHAAGIHVQRTVLRLFRHMHLMLRRCRQSCVTKRGLSYPTTLCS